MDLYGVGRAPTSEGSIAMLGMRRAAGHGGGQHNAGRWRRPVLRMSGATAIALVTVGIAGAGLAGAQPRLDVGTCPALFALGVQGTGESSPDAAPSTDTGMLSTVFQPMMAKAAEKGLVDRAYVPYESGFGGAVPGGKAPYSQSVQGGLSALRGMVQSIAGRCDKTRFAVAGYSQGAHVASMFANEVGAGSGVIPADRIAGVALFADPTRNPGSPLFPGAAGKQTPDPAPGTSGALVQAVKVLAQTPAAGGGIGPQRDIAANFGALTGRVATFCMAGDLACDAPTGAPILRVVANIAGQSQLSGGDPIASLASVAQALAFTSIKAASSVVNEDLQGNSLDSLSLSPQKSLSQRLADASDPRTPVDVPGAVQALLKVGMIGLNAVITVAKTLITPENIAELATVGLANPPVALALFGTKLVGALPQLVPPTTVSRLVQQSFQAVVENVKDNSDLLNTATWSRYWDLVQRHHAYGSQSVTANGQAPVQFVADWFAAAAKDVAAKFGKGAEAPGAPKFSPGSGVAPTQRVPVAGDFPFGTTPPRGSTAPVVPTARPTSPQLWG